MATNLVVGIAAEYKGKPAFKAAEKDIFGLNKGVKQLAKAYVGLAGAQKAFSYASASVKAFVQDDKAARQLSKTVGNLGLAYEATNVENFIQGLEKTYHINDDFLRPSFAKLIQVTQSYTKSKELLTTAINASAGAGVDLTTTVQDLSQAYVGNLRGLRKYNLGLTQAELATMTFQQIQDKLNQTFTGQAALAADTYAGKIEALAIASNNAKEIIGKDEYIDVSIDYNFQPIYADVSIVNSSDELDIEKFKNWREEYKDAIFITEDDSQGGWDHISAYRTIGLVVSAYSTGKLVTSNYNQTSIVRTIEQILGLPPMNIMDGTARLMTDCFQKTKNSMTYTALPNTIPLDQMNKPLKALQGKAKKYALQSQLEVFKEVDGGEDDKMNRIIWFYAKGDTKYPEIK